MRRLTPCLWFDDEAEQAAEFYVSVFPSSRINHVERYTVDTPSKKPIGSVMTVTFQLSGNEFMALNGGPYFKFNEAVSLMIPCENQKEINYYYKKLSADPKAEVCGWLKDKYGFSWQLIPKEFDKIMRSAGQEEKERALKALMKMKRIDVKKLRTAAAGK